MREFVRSNAKAITALVGGLVSVYVTDPSTQESISAIVLAALVWLVSNDA